MKTFYLINFVNLIAGIVAFGLVLKLRSDVGRQGQLLQHIFTPKSGVNY